MSYFAYQQVFQALISTNDSGKPEMSTMSPCRHTRHLLTFVLKQHTLQLGTGRQLAQPQLPVHLLLGWLLFAVCPQRFLVSTAVTPDRRSNPTGVYSNREGSKANCSLRKLILFTIFIMAKSKRTK